MWGGGWGVKGGGREARSEKDEKIKGWQEGKMIEGTWGKNEDQIKRDE